MNEIASYPSLKDKVVLITGGASGIGAQFWLIMLQMMNAMTLIVLHPNTGITE